MRKLAVFTSGGDAPGMNAAIRAVVRTAVYSKLEIIGIRRGYAGMIEGDFVEMNSNSVSNIIQRGGTILKTARSEEFLQSNGRKKAFDRLKAEGIEALVAIGGDGTFRGALTFEKEYGIPTIGIPGTIDNDLYGTDYTIGFDTAVNTVVQAVDKIRDTADSHNRLFIIEVMGRDAGFIALHSGIAVGAEAVMIPESKNDLSELVSILEQGWARNKSSSIIIVAEGEEEGGAYEVARKLKLRFDHYDTRVTVLGHIQRGGSPSAIDRLNASLLGVAAIEALLEGKKNTMVGMISGKISYVAFDSAVKSHEAVNENLIRIARILSL